eukprot:6694095-Alexandrium_andersonii.AAC.1
MPKEPQENPHEAPTQPTKSRRNAPKELRRSRQQHRQIRSCSTHVVRENSWGTRKNNTSSPHVPH